MQGIPVDAFPAQVVSPLQCSHRLLPRALTGLVVADQALQFFGEELADRNAAFSGCGRTTSRSRTRRQFSRSVVRAVTTIEYILQ
jgi:hypothetical protein